MLNGSDFIYFLAVFYSVSAATKTTVELNGKRIASKLIFFSYSFCNVFGFFELVCLLEHKINVKKAAHSEFNCKRNALKNISRCIVYSRDS